MATLLVQSGVLSKGDIVLVGDEFGKIRSMIDDTQKQITSRTITACNFRVAKDSNFR